MGTAEDIEIDLAPGSRENVGRFRVGVELASGGMASVHLASPIGSAEVIAIKLVHPHLADDPDFVEMFLDEARIASRIVHPHVCRVFEFGEADDTLFLTMELMAGAPLSAIARASRREGVSDPEWQRTAARIVADMCAGLHAAHELVGEDGEPMHVVHRDVSPQNVFVGFDGVAKILDFGIAAADHRLHKTAAGIVKGKFAYIAPEQIHGRRVDRRADVWAAGVVLWELLAGRSLFRGKNDAETVGAVLAGRVPPLENVPGALSAIVSNALRVEPDLRTESADAMRRALEQWLGDFGTSGVARTFAQLLPNERAAFEARIREHARTRSNDDLPPLESGSYLRLRTPQPPAPLRPWPSYLAAALLVVLVAGAMWWLGQRILAAPFARSTSTTETRP